MECTFVTINGTKKWHLCLVDCHFKGRQCCNMRDKMHFEEPGTAATYTALLWYAGGHTQTKQGTLINIKTLKLGCHAC